MSEWVRDPDALFTVRQLRAWRVGDEVQVDVEGWVKARRWKPTGRAFSSGRMGHISGMHPTGTPEVMLDTGKWMTAHEHIIAWRPKRREPCEG